MTEETSPAAVGSGNSGDIRPKRQVSYNQEAVLCPFCTKRIRLNNSGTMRVHVFGKAQSEQCLGSKRTLARAEALSGKIEGFAEEAEKGYEADQLTQRTWPAALFSDQQQ